MTPTETLVPSVESRATLADVALIAEAAGRVSRHAQGSGRWPRDDRQGALHAVDRAIDLLATSRAALLVAERESGTWRGGGDRSFEAWRARDSRLGERAAVAQVRQAEQLAGVPAVVEAVTDGEIPLAHAAVLAKVASTGSPAQRRAVTSPEARGMLFGLAREEDAGTFATTVARWAATVDPDGLESDHTTRPTAATSPSRGSWVPLARVHRVVGNAEVLSRR